MAAVMMDASVERDGGAAKGDLGTTWVADKPRPARAWVS